jgi:hypothetical protein
VDRFEFQPAVRKAVPALIALTGPSGSGKTYTALALATGLAAGGDIYLIDTENRRALLYADDFRFRHLEFGPPYDPARFVQAIQAAIAAGASAVILDSATPEWDGTGGVMEIVDAAMVKFKGNKFAAWSVGTPKHALFVNSLVRCSVHLVVTMRSKMAYEQDEQTGKVTKVGMQPIQRPGFDYEFPFWGDIDMEHRLLMSKSNWRELQDALIVKPGPEVGVRIREWLDSGEYTSPVPPAVSTDLPSSVDGGGDAPEQPKLNDHKPSAEAMKFTEHDAKTFPALAALEPGLRLRVIQAESGRLKVAEAKVKDKTPEKIQEMLNA